MKCKECKLVEMRVQAVEDVEVTFVCPKCNKEVKTIVEDNKEAN